MTSTPGQGIGEADPSLDGQQGPGGLLAPAGEEGDTTYSNAGDLVVEEDEQGPFLLLQDSFCDIDQVLRTNAAASGKAKPGSGGAKGGGETIVCTLDCDRGMLPVLSMRQGRSQQQQPYKSDVAITLNGGVVVPGPAYSLAPGARLKVEGLGNSSLILKVRTSAGKHQLQRSKSLPRDVSAGDRAADSVQASKSETQVGGEKTNPAANSTTATIRRTTASGGGGGSSMSSGPSDLDSTLKALRAEQTKKDRPPPLMSVKSTEAGPTLPSEEARQAPSDNNNSNKPEEAAKKAEADRAKRHAAKKAYVANRSEFTAHFRSCLKTPEQIDISLLDDSFPHVRPPSAIMEQLKWIMKPYLRQQTAILQRLEALPVGSCHQFIAITAPSGSIMHQERLLSALAKDLGADFLCIPGLPPINHKDVTSEDGNSTTTAFPLFTPTQRTFKVGDRVLYQGTNSQLKQRTGRILSVPENGASSIGVRFDLPFAGGHSCGSLCDAPHGYFVMSVDIILIEDPTKESKSGALKDFSNIAALREALMNVALGRSEMSIKIDSSGGGDVNPTPLPPQAISSTDGEEGPLPRADTTPPPPLPSSSSGEHAKPEEEEEAQQGQEKKDQSLRPCIIFLPEMAELLTKAPPSTFKALFSDIKRTVPIVVVAGFRSVKLTPSTSKKASSLPSSSAGAKLGMMGIGRDALSSSSSSSSYAVLDSVSAQGLDPQVVNTFFPCQLVIEKPTEAAEAKRWDDMVERDGPHIRARRNVRRLKAGLHVAGAFFTQDTAEALLEHHVMQASSFRMDTLARLVMGACNEEMSSSPPPTSEQSAAEEVLVEEYKQGGVMPATTTTTITAEPPQQAEPKEGDAPMTAAKTESQTLPPLEIRYASLDRALTLLLDTDGSGGSGQQKDKKLAKKPLTTHEEELKESALITADQIGVGFDDVQLDAQVKERLQELIVLPLRKPHLFKRGNLTAPTRGVLLFGPPGTGKTSLAKAVATEVGANFISVNVSNMMSMWFGESEKYCRALFSLAVKLAPTIIFIDEVDALLGKRGGKEHEAMRKFKAEALAQWDGLTTSQAERVTVLGATNRPWDLDEAVLRRFSRRLYVKLPNPSMRERILQVMLKDEVLSADFDFSAIASDASTQGFSGSDLRNVCIAAAYKPLRDYLAQEMLLAQQQQQQGGEEQQQVDELAKSVAPTKAIMQQLEEQQQKEVEDSLRPLTTRDFLEAVKEVGASVSSDSPEAMELSTWNEMYGEKGSRRKSATAISAMYL